MTTPIPAEDLPKALAEAMGWKKCYHPENANECWDTGRDIKCYYDPVKNRNHSRFAIDRCLALGLADKYVDYLIKVLEAKKHYTIDTIRREKHFASPEDESRAALATLTGK